MPSISLKSPDSNISSAASARSHRLAQSARKRQKRPSSWSERVRDSLFNRSDPPTKVKSHSHGKDGPLSQTSAALINSTEPKKGSLMKLRNYKGKKKLATIGEAGQTDNEKMASDSGTVRRTQKPSPLRDTVASMKSPGPRTASGKHERTVGRDDYLTARGANPRTGVVSPSLPSHSSNSRSSSSHDDQLINRDFSMDTKWRLKGNQWISMDRNAKTPLPSPPSEKQTEIGLSDAEGKARSYLHRLQQRGIRNSQVGDQFVVNMPSAREPCPRTMTTSQIFEFQRAIDRVYRNGENPMHSAPPPEPVHESQDTPPFKPPFDRFYSIPHPAARARQRNTPLYGQSSSAGPYQGPEIGQRPFLDNRAKGTPPRAIGNRPCPSPQWTMAMPRVNTQQQIRPADTGRRHREFLGNNRPQCHRRQSDNFLERRGPNLISPRPLSAPTRLSCPKPALQRDALTTITITTDTPTLMTEIPQENEDFGQSRSPNLADEMEKHCASVSPISQRNQDTTLVVVSHPGNDETVEDKLQHTITDIPIQELSQMPTDNCHDMALPRTPRYSATWLQLLCFILHCVLSSLIYCVNASKDLYTRFRHRPTRLTSRTSRKLSPSITDYWIVVVFFTIVVNVLWKTTVYILKFALAQL